VWAFDEHRIGLKPILRRIWARRGSSPRAVVQHRYEWLYLYAFVHPHTGRTSWWLVPTVRTDIFSQVLAAFAREVGAGPQKQILLVLDNAGWHTSTAVHVPDGLHLVFLPPYSPELQPAERLWPLSNAPLLNRAFASLDELIAVQSERCCVLVSQPQRIRSATRFHWWPSTA
jgi:hypothetical protein